MQILNTNAGADTDGRNGVADEYALKELRIKYPNDRAKYLCDLAGKACGGLFGDNNAGDQTDETTGGGTPGGEETTNEWGGGGAMTIQGTPFDL